MMAILRLGLMIALQEEIHSFKPMVVQVLSHQVHTQVLELNAKDSIRNNLISLINWLNMMVTLRLGSMTAIQVETHSFKPMVALVL